MMSEPKTVPIPAPVDENREEKKETTRVERRTVCAKIIISKVSDQI